MSNVATFPQAKHLIEVFETLGSDQLQALYASGLLTDLRRCAAELDPTKVDRDQYLRVLGFDPSVFVTKLGGETTTDQIVAGLREAGLWVNDYVTQANFPLQPRSAENDEIEIVDPGTSFSEEEGLQFLKSKGLLRPTYEHALRFAEQHGKTNVGDKPYIIFLHDAWQDPDRARRVLCVGRSLQYRRLGLYYPDGRFSDYCVLAGVRPRK